MKRYAASDLLRLLEAIDASLAGPVELVVIGGAAAALAYGVTSGTRDIDTMTGTAEIEEAYAIARRVTGLAIPLGRAAVADGPYRYEERLKQLEIRGLKKLKVIVPEKHDLVLMKVVRGYENDLAAAEELHSVNPLKYETLVERFRTEMSHVVARSTTLRLNFLACIERIFGEEKADEAKRRLARPHSRRRGRRPK